MSAAIAATAIAVGTVASGYMQAQGAEKAARAQGRAADASIAEQREAREQSRMDLEPYRAVGDTALPLFTRLLTQEGEQEYFRSSPILQNALAETARQTGQEFAVGGKYHSGQRINELFKRNAALSEDFLNSRFNRLLQGANIGQSSAAGQANIAQNTAQNIGATLLEKGNAQAAGHIGRANAVSGAIDGVVGAYTGYRRFNS